MENQTKNALLVWGSTLAGGTGGWWVTGRICKSLGVKVAPWGPVVGGLIGALASAALSKNMLADSMEFPGSESEDL
ncbi:MAG: hypothetical protein GY703_11975 [Gammaproteobacteria bacterium]|nr:hypothetical protein [Gammaproteobacteria bacterium]